IFVVSAHVRANHTIFFSQNVEYIFFFFSSRRRHTRSKRDWSSDVCSSDLVYHWLSRKNNTISGHEEKNLKQINTFVIDFDTSDIEYIDILNAGLNLEVMPTMILKTDKGFHAYFILENPV